MLTYQEVLELEHQKLYFKKDKRQQGVILHQLINENFFVPTPQNFYLEKDKLIDRIDNTKRQVRDLALDKKCEALQNEIRFLTDLKPKVVGSI